MNLGIRRFEGELTRGNLRILGKNKNVESETKRGSWNLNGGIL